jgi:hypothetical protein
MARLAIYLNVSRVCRIFGRKHGSVIGSRLAGSSPIEQAWDGFHNGVGY